LLCCAVFWGDSFGLIRGDSPKVIRGVIRFLLFTGERNALARLRLGVRACAWARVCLRVCVRVTRVCACARGGCGKNVTPHGWVWFLCIPVAKRRHCCENTTKTTPIFTQIEVISVPKSNVFSGLASIPTPICAIRVTKGGRGRGPVGG